MENKESSTSQGFKFGCGLGLGCIAAVIIVVVGLPIVGLSMCGMCANVTDHANKVLITKEQAEIETVISSIEMISRALDRYATDNGMYPTTEQGLDALVRKPTSQPEPINWMAAYVEPTKFLDLWGVRYIYKCPSNHEGYDYDLYSYGADGMEGGGDDVTNWLVE